MFDVVITNGIVIDGTGGKGQSLDVGIAGGIIKAIDVNLGDQAGQVLDARGHIVAPGFIDVHSHCDLVPFMQGPVTHSRILQGVTTELVGQCGLGPVPYLSGAMAEWKQYLKAILGEPDVEWNWTCFDSYLTALAGAKSPHNVGALVTHGALRAMVVGLGNTIPGEEHLLEMQHLLCESMEEGALGISFGLAYLPGVFASREEMVALCKVVAAFDGIMMIHIRSHSCQVREAMQEALTIAAESGVKLQISHMRSYANRAFGISGEELIAMVEEAVRRGVDVTFDQHPYTAGSTLLSQILPPWAKEGGGPRIVERLQDRAVVNRLREELQNTACNYPGWDNFIGIAGWGNLVLSAVKQPQHQKFVGKSLLEIAELLGVDVVEAAVKLIVDEEAQSCMVMHNLFSVQDIVDLLRHPLCQIGSDGIPTGNPHPRLYGTFPKFLGTYVRDRRLMSWEEAVKRLTGNPAKRLGLKDRGLLKPGCAADVVIFDPLLIRDHEDYNNPAQFVPGIDYVLVNGAIAVQNGVATAAEKGKVLRRVP